ncbi:hypothetical protein PPL_09744 [Heterostelium album PN500]|uniref:Uncharacterized protein n=1 Tax=Heterostelium pallidum (strain ATCC 26659 / Pp 5 / PN500) TaxID=670386 RepID=D3BNP1_HETP5|nr:hypothetical protein PPL_09744 [Heterostelium album PN500]EFA76992.1 hypothetical protein PPL_09744 [Heterostelium album PN500]|eukprot:XP_020429123.1 hypothetical protein PPL_09744 [Heterostelium album PN500]
MSKKLFFILLLLLISTLVVLGNEEVVDVAETVEEVENDDGVICPPVDECYAVITDCSIYDIPFNPRGCCPKCDCRTIKCGRVNETECLLNGGVFKRAYSNRCCDKCESICDRVFCAPVINCNGIIIKADPINGRCCDRCLVLTSTSGVTTGSSNPNAQCENSFCIPVNSNNCKGKIIPKKIEDGICCDSCQNYCDYVQCSPVNKTICIARGGQIVDKDITAGRCCEYCKTVTSSSTSSSSSSTSSSSSSSSTTTGATTLSCTIPCPYVDEWVCRAQGKVLVPANPPTRCCPTCEYSSTTFVTTYGWCVGQICPIVNPHICYASGGYYYGPDFSIGKCCPSCESKPPPTSSSISSITTTGYPNVCDSVKCKSLSPAQCLSQGQTFLPAYPPYRCCDSCNPIFVVDGLYK